MSSIFRKIALATLPFLGAGNTSANDLAEKHWQSVYDARTKFYENNIGALPSDILKIGHMTGVWPGGGPFVIPAQKLGKDVWVFTTYGFTNPDMPTTVTVSNVKVTSDGPRVTSTEGTLTKKEHVRSSNGRPGYGYEILVVTKENAEWPLWFLQWAANAEILNDADLISRVDKYKGLTVEKIKAGPNLSINVLIAKAKSPLPTGTVLPNGEMTLLVATTITDAEMRWSMKNGREALLQKLEQTGIGQFSLLNRASVVE